VEEVGSMTMSMRIWIWVHGGGWLCGGVCLRLDLVPWRRLVAQQCTEHNGDNAWWLVVMVHVWVEFMEVGGG